MINIKIFRSLRDLKFVIFYELVGYLVVEYLFIIRNYT
jgi:hypothetical protein